MLQELSQDFPGVQEGVALIEVVRAAVASHLELRASAKTSALVLGFLDLGDVRSLGVKTMQGVILQNSESQNSEMDHFYLT